MCIHVNDYFSYCKQHKTQDIFKSSTQENRKCDYSFVRVPFNQRAPVMLKFIVVYFQLKTERCMSRREKRKCMLVLLVVWLWLGCFCNVKNFMHALINICNVIIKIGCIFSFNFLYYAFGLMLHTVVWLGFVRLG